jgi:hypothetical protein
VTLWQRLSVFSLEVAYKGGIVSETTTQLPSLLGCELNYVSSPALLVTVIFTYCNHRASVKLFINISPRKFEVSLSFYTRFPFLRTLSAPWSEPRTPNGEHYIKLVSGVRGVLLSTISESNRFNFFTSRVRSGWPSGRHRTSADFIRNPPIIRDRFRPQQTQVL